VQLASLQPSVNNVQFTVDTSRCCSEWLAMCEECPHKMHLKLNYIIHNDFKKILGHGDCSYADISCTLPINKYHEELQ
jgi:hypothetical protein